MSILRNGHVAVSNLGVKGPKYRDEGAAHKMGAFVTVCGLFITISMSYLDGLLVVLHRANDSRDWMDTRVLLGWIRGWFVIMTRLKSSINFDYVTIRYDTVNR